VEAVDFRAGQNFGEAHESLPCRRWEAFTTDTNDGQLERSHPLINIYTDPARWSSAPGADTAGRSQLGDSTSAFWDRGTRSRSSAGTLY